MCHEFLQQGLVCCVTRAQADIGFDHFARNRIRNADGGSFGHGRVGEEVDPFMDEALARIQAQYELLFYGVDLKQHGRADYDQMLANVADLPPDERRRLMLAGLNELVASIQLGVRQTLGAQEIAVVSGIIKEAYRKLGVG